MEEARLDKTYDFHSRVKKVAVSGLPDQRMSFKYNYNELGQRVQNQREDGTFWDYQYDDLGEVVLGQKKFADGTALNGYDYGYTFDDIGNRTQTMTNGRTEAYLANSVNQYTQRNVSGAIDIVGWANPVDEVSVNNLSPSRQGNFFYKELPVSNSGGPVYEQVDVSAENAANVVTTKSGKRYVPKTPEAFSYDDDGNLLSDGRWNYTWDGENRLIAMEAIASAPADAKVKLEFLYDWRGRRIRKTVALWNTSTNSYDAPTKTTKFIYDGWNLLAEMENGVLARSYIWGPDLSGTFEGAGGVGGLLMVTPAGENPQMVFSDANGNVSMLADIKTGEVTAEYEYGPFGELVRSTGRLADENPFQFSSKYQDGESGLLYYGYRYYDAGVGRWVSRDPIGEKGGLDLYQVNNNDLLGHIDVLGLCPYYGYSPPLKPKASGRTTPYYVLERDILYDPVNDSPKVWVAKQVAYHAEINDKREPNEKPGKTDRVSPAYLKDKGELDDGTPCKCVTLAQLDACMGRWANTPDITDNTFGRNCHTQVRTQLTNCCLVSDYSPPMYAGTAVTVKDKPFPKSSTSGGNI